MNLKQIIFLFSALVGCNFQIKAAHSETGQSELVEQWIKAAMDCDLELMQKLVGNVDPNAQNKKGLTALMIAAYHNDEEMIELLLQVPGINVNTKNQKGDTALIFAANCGSEDTVNLLLQVPGIDINAQNQYGDTVLIYAVAHHGRENIAELLLQVPGIDINAQNAIGKTALMVAVQADNENIVNLLLQTPGININAQDKAGRTALMCSRSITKKQIQNKLTSNAFLAINQNDLEELKLIVAQMGIDGIVDSEGNTLLDKACEANSPEIILYLLAHAKNPQEELARFPFERLNPASPIFEYLIYLAYGTHNKALFLNIFRDSLHKTISRKKDRVAAEANKGPDKPAKKELEVAEKKEKSREKSLARINKGQLLKELRPELGICAVDGNPNATSRCSACQKVYYCNAACQKAHWNRHQLFCRL